MTTLQAESPLTEEDSRSAQSVSDHSETAKPFVVFFSNVSNNTTRFVQKLDVRAERIPLRRKDDPLLITEPYVLIVPTYGDGDPKKAVPKQVGKFLNEPQNRKWIRGVIAGGNINFGSDFGKTGDIISEKCKVPVLYKFEIMGTPEDVEKVQQGLEEFWKKLS